MRRAVTGLLLVAPAVIPLGIFVVLPAFGSLWLSLTDWQLVGNPNVQGLDNYFQLVQDSLYLNAMAVTLQIAIGTAIPSAILALCLALLLDSGVKRTGPYQPLLFLPAVLPSVVSAIVWGMLYQGDGPINQTLGLHVGWITDPRWALPAIALLLVWTNLGYFTIVMLAGVRDVPRDYAEAARIDGAGWFAITRFITVPLIRPALLFVLVIATANALTLFVQPYVLTRGGPADATRGVSELIYETAFSFQNVGKASAMAFLLLVVAMGVAAAQFRLLRRKDV